MLTQLCELAVHFTSLEPANFTTEIKAYRGSIKLNLDEPLEAVDVAAKDFEHIQLEYFAKDLAFALLS